MYTTQNCACENGWGLFWDVMHTQKLVWDRTVLVDLISDIISTKFQYLFERAYNSTIVLFGHTPKTLYDRLFFIKCKKGTISNPVWLLWCPETNKLFQFCLNESWKILHVYTLWKCLQLFRERLSEKVQATIRQLLWMVLSALFFKEIWMNDTGCLRCYACDC